MARNPRKARSVVNVAAEHAALGEAHVAMIAEATTPAAPVVAAAPLAPIPSRTMTEAEATALEIDAARKAPLGIDGERLVAEMRAITRSRENLVTIVKAMGNTILMRLTVIKAYLIAWKGYSEAEAIAMLAKSGKAKNAKEEKDYGAARVFITGLREDAGFAKDGKKSRKSPKVTNANADDDDDADANANANANGKGKGNGKGNGEPQIIGAATNSVSVAKVKDVVGLETYLTLASRNIVASVKGCDLPGAKADALRKAATAFFLELQRIAVEF